MSSNKQCITKRPDTVTESKIRKSDFKAPFWARNRHIQTLWPRFLQRRKPLSVRKQKLTLPDGDFVNVVWGEPQVAEPVRGLAVIFHGLEGSVKSHYANDLMADLQTKGWQTVLMHYRGCGGEPNATVRAYHSGETQDARFFLEWLNAQFPALPKVAIGFSLGANMLLKFLGENPSQTLLKAAIAISAPLKLDECAKSINKGFSRVYQNYLLKSMITTLRTKMRSLDYSSVLSIKDEQVSRLPDFRSFDEQVTAPLHGFVNADDYYQQCSAIGYLKHIATPTLVLHSMDDPFMNEAVIPQEHELSDAITFELSENGGHVGFMQGTPWRPSIWFHRRINAFLAPFKLQKDVKE